MYPADQSVAFLTVALRRNRFCSDSDNWIWIYMLCIFPLSLLLDPRRSVVWRTPWLLWRWTTKSLFVPTLCPIRVCRRTWSLPNTTCCECRSSCPWQRRYFNGSVYLQLNASLVNRWCQVWTNRITCYDCVCFAGVGQEVPANCSLPQHEGDPDQEKWADQRNQKTIAEVSVIIIIQNIPFLAAWKMQLEKLYFEHFNKRNEQIVDI